MTEGLTGVTEKGEVLRVREVWASNLDQEIDLIRNVIDNFPFVAMDTEFPGVVARPVGNFKSSREYQYKALKINVDMLKLIQLGLTLTDAEGNLPKHNGELCVWQFNFRGFCLHEDVYAQDSIELLKQSGIDFSTNEARGIDVQRFGEVLMSSGVVLNDELKWITFHSGYDFGYLLKVLTNQQLPATEVEFFELLNIYFPNIYDMKYLMKFCDNLHGKWAVQAALRAFELLPLLLLKSTHYFFVPASYGFRIRCTSLCCTAGSTQWSSAWSSVAPCTYPA